MTLRLNPEAQAALDRLVEARHGLSANEVINQILVETERRTERAEQVARLFDEGEHRWADVLDRLRRA